MGLAAAYVIYAASTYSGLYRMSAELELRAFGSYDPTGTFLFLFFALCLPAVAIATRIWKKAEDTPLAIADDSEAAQRRTRNTMLTIGAVSLVVGLVAAGLALFATFSSHQVAELDLNRTSGSSSPPGRVMVSGRLQPDYAVTIQETINGSKTQTIYTPVTATHWNANEPVRYVLRENLGRVRPGVEVGELPTPDQVRFGPVATFRHAMPGIARTGFEQHGLRLDSSVTIFDKNLSRANETLLLVTTFGLLSALIFLTLWRRMVVTQRLNAVEA
ncbi:hypothetical protein [Terriglobus sp.]|uniref:hypothetical protein n=1 Tax=Terriglobus sp. TaxID=1889013 RepID=UPI003B00CBA7